MFYFPRGLAEMLVPGEQSPFFEASPLVLFGTTSLSF